MKNKLLIFTILAINSATFAQINSNSFGNRVNFTSVGTGVDGPLGMALADFDGDGKIDIAVSNSTTDNISVFKNVSSSILNSSSLATPVSFGVGSRPTTAVTHDLDGDGKNELLTSSFYMNTISILRNISSMGTINFSAKIDIPVGKNSGDISFGDIDGDGKDDIINCNFGTKFFSVHRNLSTLGNIVLDTRLDFSTTGSGFEARELVITDVDMDNKLDVVVLYYNGYVSIFKNTSTIGNVSFANDINLIGIKFNAGISSGDIDADGKADLLVSSYNSGEILVFKNTTTSGTISFNSYVSYPVGLNPHTNLIINIDSDSKPDIVVCNRGSNNISILRNTSSIGTINNNSFANKVDFVTGASPIGVGFVDLNGDNKKDIITSNYNDNTITILTNNIATGISSYKFLSSGEIEIFPIPTSDFLTLNANEGIILSYEIINLEGKLIQGENVNSKELKLDARKLIQGIYFIKLNTDKGFVTRKIVKE